MRSTPLAGRATQPPAASVALPASAAVAPVRLRQIQPAAAAAWQSLLHGRWTARPFAKPGIARKWQWQYHAPAPMRGESSTSFVFGKPTRAQAAPAPTSGIIKAPPASPEASLSDGDAPENEGTRLV